MPLGANARYGYGGAAVRVMPARVRPAGRVRIRRWPVVATARPADPVGELTTAALMVEEDRLIAGVTGNPSHGNAEITATKEWGRPASCGPHSQIKSL
jgi:hypothetical protein